MMGKGDSNHPDFLDSPGVDDIYYLSYQFQPVTVADIAGV